jgi:Amt family ammonium transporter
VAVTIVWSGVGSLVILLVLKPLLGGLRVEAAEEDTGLDLTQHEERGYILN